MKVNQFNNILTLPFLFPFYFFHIFSYGSQWFFIMNVNLKFDFTSN
jgi:hypothetical protein